MFQKQKESQCSWNGVIDGKRTVDELGEGSRGACEVQRFLTLTSCQGRTTREATPRSAQSESLAWFFVRLPGRYKCASGWREGKWEFLCDGDEVSVTRDD